MRDFPLKTIGGATAAKTQENVHLLGKNGKKNKNT